MNNTELPVGFGMALAMNRDAMNKFASLTDKEKQTIISGTHAIKSKEEMHQYVLNILNEH